MRGTGFLAYILTAQAVLAGPPELLLPVDCILGQSCYIEDYVDADPGPAQADFTCGLKSRDGHRGTDIMLDSFAAMTAGVTVRAAAAGQVSATRDGMDDIAITPETREAVNGRECGNAVRINHGDGWQTLYCHLRKGSVTVQPGEDVTAGTPIGLVGLSGLTNVPHLHLTVLKDGAVVDPFAPDDTQNCAAPDGDTLWRDTPGYQKAGLFTAGFSTSVPGFDAVKSGAARAARATPADPLVLYGHVFHAEPGDTLRLRAEGPGGEVFSQTETLEDPQAQFFRAFGHKAPDGGWTPGAYRGYVRLERAGTLIAWRHAEIEITSR